MECIDLRENFGRQYKITYDEAYDAKGRHRDKLDPWLMQIICQRGTIYPFGGTKLVVEVDNRSKLAGRMQRLGCVTPIQKGDHEKSFLFDVEHFDEVAEIVRPRRRRQVSDEVRERLARLGTRFKPKSRGRVDVDGDSEASEA
jgi:hypothetical protein